MVETCKTTFGGLRYVPRGGIPCDMTDAATYPDIGHRLASIRQGFSDLNQTEWAKRHNFATTQYNNWEKGTRRIPVEASEKLCEIYGLTLDFIYRGRRDGLSETASKVL